ncbi:hypothetical protein L1049_021108 [Liquidambar formosana]|uniref:Uncharacterized protein n=1 Tax=Liquidambar formosana TaxID=63359 RepID=A0AAP0X804_LIQFO
MEGETEKVVAPGIEIDGCKSSASPNPNAGQCSASQGITTEPNGKHSSDNSESFYQKLSGLYESSGLSLLFNFRETIVDLYLLYKEVTERGGYHQVTKDGSWDDIVSAINLKCTVPKLSLQLQKLYSNLLYKFEQIYFYRTHVKVAAAPCHTFDTGISLTGKRKGWDSFSQLSTSHSAIEDAPMEKRQCKNNPCQVSTDSRTAELKLRTSSKNNERKDPDAPLGIRSPYQFFLKKECFRLKEMHGESLNGQNVRKMATDAWRCLSESDRQPYIEESRKDKERYGQEMTAYKERRNMQDTKTGNRPCNSKTIVNYHHHTPLRTAGDYYVTSLPDAENFPVDEAMIESAIKLMENAQPNDPMFQIYWDDYCGSLDIPNE